MGKGKEPRLRRQLSLCPSLFALCLLLTLVQSLFRLHQHPAQPYQLIEGQVKTRSIEEAALDCGGDRVVRELLENHDFKVAARAISNFEVREFGDGLARFSGGVYRLHQRV